MIMFFLEKLSHDNVFLEKLSHDPVFHTLIKKNIPISQTSSNLMLLILESAVAGTVLCWNIVLFVCFHKTSEQKSIILY